jgi:hypothetical protein
MLWAPWSTALQMNIGRNPENLAAGLSVPERTLLFCIASGTDWQNNADVTRATVAATMLKGLVERNASGQLTLSGEGNSTVGVLLKGG